jgi:hypothetical protein
VPAPVVDGAAAVILLGAVIVAAASFRAARRDGVGFLRSLRTSAHTGWVWLTMFF